MTDFSPIFNAINALANSIANLNDRVQALETDPNVGQSYTNLLANGGFENWSGGPGPFTADGPCADGWELAVGTGSTTTVIEDSSNQDTIASTVCAAVAHTHARSSYLRQSVGGPFVNTPIAISVRVKTFTSGAVRLSCEGKLSNYHSGLGGYETLAIVAVPAVTPFVVAIEFDADCTAYIDSAFVCQGVHPLDYIWSPT